MAPRLPPLDASRPLRYATVFYLYVMQGIPAGFALTAVANRLAAQGVTPPAIGRFIALVGLPWTLQFVWGPLIDRFQGSPMGRRKPWVFFAQLCALGASLGLLLVGDPARDLTLLTAAFVCHSVFASVQDASVDAMAITVTRPDERPRTNAFMRGGMLVGQGIGAAGFATIMRQAGFRGAALALSLVLLAFTVLTFLVRERAGDGFFPWSRRRPREAPPAVDAEPGAAAEDLSLRRIFATLVRGLLDAESLRLFGAILAVYFAASVFIRTLSTHLVQRLHWDDTSLSVLIGTSGMAAALGAILAAGAVSGRLGPRRLLLTTMLVIGGYLVAFSALGPYWPHVPLTRGALAVWYTFDPTYSVAAMPALMALCRRGVEGSQFTTYMALVNLSDVAGSYVSGYALTVLPAPAIGLACGALVLGAAAAVQRSAFGRPAPAPGVPVRPIS